MLDFRAWNRRRRSAGKNPLSDKPREEKDIRVLNEKLYPALSRSQVGNVEELAAGLEKSATDASLKEELEKMFAQRAASEKRMGVLDAEVKEMRVCGAAVRTSKELEKLRIGLEENLLDTSKKIATLDAENDQLCKILFGKERVIQDLRKHRDALQADFNALKLRLESSEKHTASLEYEKLVLEKELEIRNKETEFSHQMAGVAQKKYQESVRKISKLEGECHRLRLLVGKKFPGSTMLIKMKSGVEKPGKELVQIRRMKSAPSLTSSAQSYVNASPEVQKKQIKLLTQQLRALEQKNRNLEDTLTKRSRELDLSRSMYAPTASRLSQSHGKTAAEPGKRLKLMHETSLAVLSDVGSDDKGSTAESWASALISELEYFKNEKQLGALSHHHTKTSNMDSIDDLADVEKFSSDKNAVVSASACPFNGNSPSEIELVTKLLKKLLHYSQLSKRNPHELLEDLKVLLEKNSVPYAEKSGEGFTSEVHVSICKILKLLQGLGMRCRDEGASESSMNSGCMVRLFLWKYEELSFLLERFEQTCKALLTGAADLEHFAHQVASDLEWMISHCFSLHDASDVTDSIKSHLNCEESRVHIDLQDKNVPSVSIVSSATGHHISSCAANAVEQGATSKADDQSNTIATSAEPGASHSTVAEEKTIAPANQMKVELEEVGETCHEQHVQQKHVTIKEVPKDDKQHREQLVENMQDPEIVAAPRILERETTITSNPIPDQAATPCFPSPVKMVRKQSSLLEKMLAEDRADLPSPQDSSPCKKNADRGIFTKLFGRQVKTGDKKALIPSFFRM